MHCEHIGLATIPQKLSNFLECSILNERMNSSTITASQAVSAPGTNLVGAGASNLLSTGSNQDSPDSLLVEVQGENSAYYKAYVKDIFDGEVLLRFEDDWQPESKFPFSR